MMICRKCESRINSGAKCFQCGHDNNNINLTPSLDNPANKNKAKRSPVLVAVMILFIFFSVSILLSYAGVITGVFELTLLLNLLSMLGLNSALYINLPMHYFILFGITIAAAIFDIVLCVNILRLKKWAYKTYIWLTAAGCVIRILNNIVVLFMIPTVIFSILRPFLFKGVLLWAIYMTDGKHLGVRGASISESASEIVKRKKQERETKE